MLISLDTETTGTDFVHGAMPFLVTTTDDKGVIRFWEWDVEPLTRQPSIPQEDIEEITELIDAADLIYTQNGKFDARALHKLNIQLPWNKVRDTLVMGHLLASNQPHNLTWMCLSYLGVDIEPFELHVKEVIKACRDIVKKEYPRWFIAHEGAPGMPSVKDSSKRDEDKPWKNDMWLERALVKQWTIDGTPFNKDKWVDSCSRYANADSEHTLPLGLEMEKIIHQRDLWAIYEHRLELMRIACEMEMYGVTAIGSYTETTITEYRKQDAESERELVEIAADYGHTLELAEGASLNDNMRDFFYGAENETCPRCGYFKRVKHWNGEKSTGGICPKCSKRKREPAQIALVFNNSDNLNLKVISGKTGNACLDKNVVQDYLSILDGSAYTFIKILSDKRKHATDLAYMESYRRFWVPVAGSPGYYRVHPSLNPFATDHLRWSSNSPNLQNVGSQEDNCDECDGGGCEICNGTGKSRMSVRNCFGPAPSREWFTADYKSIERRIPAYESKEPKMVEVFEKPNEPPYWGNLYLLTASVLYPEEYWPCAETEGLFRKQYPKLYKQAKFFDLAKQYGCGKRKGDLLSKVKGSSDLVESEFPLLAALQAHYLSFAQKNGYVETLPDRTIDPIKGYPILASRTEDGHVLSTTPFNYHISGTACWVKNKALVRCSEQLEKWRAEEFDGYIALEIHDEILFDFPKGKTPDENVWRVKILKELMEESGRDIGIPTPCSVEYHDKSWPVGAAIAV